MKESNDNFCHGEGMNPVTFRGWGWGGTKIIYTVTGGGGEPTGGELVYVKKILYLLNRRSEF